MHQIAAKAVAFGEAMDPSFAQYAQQTVTNARAMAEVFIEHNVRLITGGTDNHLILADVFDSFGIGGEEAEQLLDAAGITLNKNIIPDDVRKPLDPSGIRFGTPALTTRGFSESDARTIADLMLEVLTKRDTTTIQHTRARIKKLAMSHPIPESFR
jgi:glycine hydroxymethyltransferase